MSIQFDQSALNAWVALCNEEGQLKAEGASADVLEAMRIRVAKALVALIQESQAAALLDQILGNGPPPVAMATAVTEEVEDPELWSLLFHKPR
jgi:hypothetical protein